MFPSPLDIPPSVDCVALAATGVDMLLPLLVGLAAVAAGVVFFALSRGRMRRGSVALTLVLLLAAGGTGLAVTAPASSASADACTLLDYKLDAQLVSPSLIDSGDAVEVQFSISNVVDRNGTPPIMVRIPKFAGSGYPLYFSDSGAEGTGWVIADGTNPDFYSFEYPDALPKGATSSIATFRFALTTADDDLEQFDFPVSIVTGSGGDSNTANNTVVISVEADGTRDYAIEGQITPPAGTTLPSGGTAQIDLRLTNVAPRDGRGPLVVRIPNQSALGTFALSGSSTGWSLVFEAPYYVLTYTPVLLEDQQSTVATLTFTASNGNSSPVDLTIPASIDVGSGGDSNDANNEVVFPLRVQGIVG